MNQALLERDEQAAPVAVAAAPLRLAAVAAVTLAVGIFIFATSGAIAGAGSVGTTRSNYTLAVCYSGQVRAFRRVYEQNVQTFHNFDPSATFFVHLDLRDSVTLPSGTHFTHNHTRTELDDALSLMQVTNPSFYSGVDVQAPPRTGCMARFDRSDARYRYHYRNFYAANACYGLVKAAEARDAHTFAWILHVRPGIFVDVRRPPPGPASRNIHMAGFDIALIPRHLGDVFFSAVRMYENGTCEELDAANEDTCGYSYVRDSPDCLAVKWLALHNLFPTSGVYVNRRVVVEG